MSDRKYNASMLTKIYNIKLNPYPAATETEQPLPPV